MNDNKILLAFEITENSILEIHGNQYGFDMLLKAIEELLQSNRDNHCHLISEGLTNDAIGKNNDRIDQVKLLYWKS
jgi:hypothetical protein